MKHGFKHEPLLTTARQAFTTPRRPMRYSDAPGSLKHSQPHRERSLQNQLGRTAPPNGLAHRLALDRTLAARLGRRLRRLGHRLYVYWISFLHIYVGDLRPLSSHFRTRLSMAAQLRRK
jgi:hypothetical protein